jgi:threonine/homoserine/homoserine lactone efflux protein
MSHIGLSIFHIAVVAPALLYVAIMRGQLSPWIFSLLSGVAIIMLVYHGYKAFIKWKAQSPSIWVNLLHIFLVAPLLLFIGSKGYDTPRWAFELLAMLGFASLGYHIYSIIMMVQDMSTKKKDSAPQPDDAH